jgi:hypothetical protein
MTLNKNALKNIGGEITDGILLNGDVQKIEVITGGEITCPLTSCPIQLYRKRSWISAFFSLIFDCNFDYYLIIIQSRKWISQKGEEFCN